MRDGSDHLDLDLLERHVEDLREVVRRVPDVVEVAPRTAVCDDPDQGTPSDVDDERAERERCPKRSTPMGSP